VTYSLHRLAEHDLASAFQFYRDTGSDKVALRLLAEFERAAEMLDANPGLGTPTVGDRRTYPLKKFPYSMIYKSVDSGVRILVIRHQRREAEYGDERA
jgi:plasmid stabilization system protein ParE